MFPRSFSFVQTDGTATERDLFGDLLAEMEKLCLRVHLECLEEAAAASAAEAAEAAAAEQAAAAAARADTAEGANAAAPPAPPVRADSDSDSDSDSEAEAAEEATTHLLLPTERMTSPGLSLRAPRSPVLPTAPAPSPAALRRHDPDQMARRHSLQRANTSPTTGAQVERLLRMSVHPHDIGQRRPVLSPSKHTPPGARSKMRILRGARASVAAFTSCKSTVTATEVETMRQRLGALRSPDVPSPPAWHGRSRTATDGETSDGRPATDGVGRLPPRWKPNKNTAARTP